MGTEAAPEGFSVPGTADLWMIRLCGGDAERQPVPGPR